MFDSYFIIVQRIFLHLGYAQFDEAHHMLLDEIKSFK